jgi:hypothetical protein
MKDSFSRRIDLVSVLPILRTICFPLSSSTSPFKLFHVRLHLYGLRGEPEVLITFLRDLQDATLARARDESIACFGCRESAVQEGMQLVANIGGHPLQCGICRHHFCRHGSCLTSTMDCNWCGILSCETCKQVEQAML